MKSFACHLIFAAFLVQTSYSQDTAAKRLPSSWDLVTCIEYAKKNNAEVNTLRLTQAAGEQNLLLAKASRLPSLIAGASQNQNHYQGNQSTSTSGYNINSSMTLYNGGYLRNDIKQKDLLLQSAELNVEQTENDITFRVTQSFLNILLAKENVIYATDLVKTSESQADLGLQQLAAGKIARKDLAQLQAQLANDKYNLVVANNQLRTNLLNLKQLLQLPPSVIFEVNAPDTVITKGVITALDEAEKLALEKRPEIQNSLLGVQIAQLDLLKAKANYKPAFMLSGTMSGDYADNNPGTYTDQLNSTFYQRIGLSLTIPIFNNRITKTNVEKSKIGIEQASLNVNNSKTILSQEVEQAYINLQNAQGQYDAADEKYRANKENYRIAEEQFKAGSTAMVDFLLQKNLYIQAVESYISAKYNTVLSLKIYEFYMGIPVKL